MYIDNILDEKQRLGISTAEIAKRSKLGLSERTIKRILNRELKSDKISNIIDIGEAIGLTEQQIFAGTTAVVTNVNVDALKADYDALLVERDALLAEIAVLKATVDELKIKVDTLKDEIIDTHKYYINKGTKENG